MTQRSSFGGALVLTLLALSPIARTQTSGRLLAVNQKDATLSVIDPIADNIFDAVGSDITAKGIVNTSPKSDEDWAKVMQGAVTLAEGSNLLKIHRPVAPPGDKNNSNGPNAPELSPEAIQAKIDADPALWTKHAEELRDSAIKVMALVKAKNAEALPELRKGAALRPDWFDLQIELGIASQHAGDADGAVAAFSEAAKLRPQDAEAFNDLGLALVQKGDAGESIPKFKTAVQLRPGDCTIRGNLAIGYMQLADFDSAITELEAAIKLAPDNASLHYNLGLALKLKDQLPAAVLEFQKAAQLDPMQADVHYTLGVTLWQQGEFAQAVAELRTATKIRPDYAEAFYTLGTVLKQQGNLPESASALREAIRLQPDFAGAHTTLAGVLRQQGDSAGAAAESKLGAEMAKSANALQSATFSTNSGRRLLNAGDLDGAISQFQSAIEQSASYALAHYYLAMAFRAKGKVEEASRWTAGAA